MPPLTVGVTGHRPNRLGNADGTLLRTRVASVLRTLTDLVAAGDSRTLVSALAEGADRIAAREALSLGFRLEALLPFPVDEYERDFGDGDSLAEFRDLLSRAAAVRALHGSYATDESRQSAYDTVGREILDRAGVLVAIWDGRRGRGEGGTADVLGGALERGVPVVWVASEAPHPVRLLAVGGGELPLDAESLRGVLGLSGGSGTD